MIYICGAIFIVCMLLFPYFRCAIFHPFSSVFYLIKDIFFYVRFCRWREFKDYGQIICATALFGGGKTLTSSVYLRHIYHRFNGKKVFNRKTGKWVTQNIIIHSNVHFNDISYIPLKSTKAIFDVCNNFQNDNFMDVHIFFVDEASTQFNSRNFKDNFNANLLNSILTCRHYKMSFVMTSQRFNHMDALLRQVTSTAKECSHFWRLYKIAYYDAYMVENCSNPTLVKPLRVKTMFIRDKDYSAYDTFAVVDNLIKDSNSGALLSDSEIIALQGNQTSSDNFVYFNKRTRKKIANSK